MNAIKVLLLTLLVFLAAQISGWEMLDRLVYVLLGLTLLAFGLSRLSLRGLGLRRDIPALRGQVGQIFTERLTLTNASPMPKLWVEIDDQSSLPNHQAGAVVTLGGHGQRQWTVSTRLRQRGRFQIGPARLRGGDLFGLFPATRLVGAPREALIYPATVPLTSAILRDGELPGGSTHHDRTPHTTPNVAGVREYAPGDGFNRIAWSASARLGRLVVKEFDLDPTANVWLTLDLDEMVHPPAVSVVDDEEHWRSSTEEFAVTVTASLAQHFLDERRAVGLMMAGQHLEVIPTDRGPRQLIKLLEALAVIRAEGAQPLGELLTVEATRFSRYSTVTIVTPATDETWLPALAVLTQAGVRATVILVDPSSFGGPNSPLLLVGELAALGIPTIVLRRQDDLAAVLAQSTTAPRRGPAARRPRGVS